MCEREREIVRGSASACAWIIVCVFAVDISSFNLFYKLLVNADLSSQNVVNSFYTTLTLVLGILM